MQIVYITIQISQAGNVCIHPSCVSSVILTDHRILTRKHFSPLSSAYASGSSNYFCQLYVTVMNAK